MRFWDSSALVPLVVSEASSAQARSWLADDPAIAIWTLTPVELVSALRRLVREGAMSDGGARNAETRIDELVRTCHVVIDVERAKMQARRLLRVHPLRAADALQLAAALEWAGQGSPAGRMVHTFDGRLGLAAAREGFLVAPEPPG